MSITPIAEVTTTDLDWFKIIVNLAGGLAIFLYGMTVMSDGLKSTAGDQLRRVIAKLTSNRIKGTLAGVFLTGLTQSSSVTTVLLVGFASAGLMSLHQSIGVILGSNIGSTFTAQIIAFDIERYVPLMIALGFFTQMLARGVRLRSLGLVLLGLGLVFAGMGLMSDATEPLRGHPTFIRAMSEMANPLWGVLIGAGVTIIIQSSTATTAMVIVLAGQGAITLEAGIALAFGANIGTCITAIIAAAGKARIAMQVAAAHTLFNVLGVIIWVALIPQFADAVRYISPASPELDGAARLAADVPRQVANAHTLFNIVNALIVLPLITPMVLLVNKLVPEKPIVEEPVAVPKYLDKDAIGTPSLALDYARLELSRLGNRVSRMMRSIRDLEHGDSDRARESLAQNRAEIEALDQKILAYLSKVARKDLPEKLRERNVALLAISSYYGELAESIEQDIASAVNGVVTSGMVVSDATRSLLQELYDVTLQSLDDTAEALRTSDADLAKRVIKAKSDVYGKADELNRHLAMRLGADEPDRTRLYRTESEMRSQLKRVYYATRRIAKHIQKLT
jgi:phosphate:Na+ symporter